MYKKCSGYSFHVSIKLLLDAYSSMKACSDYFKTNDSSTREKLDIAIHEDWFVSIDGKYCNFMDIVAVFGDITEFDQAITNNACSITDMYVCSSKDMLPKGIIYDFKYIKDSCLNIRNLNYNPKDNPKSRLATTDKNNVCDSSLSSKHNKVLSLSL